MRAWAWLRTLAKRIVDRVLRRKPPPVVVVVKKLQRDVLRARLERARRRYDKFVEPKGPEPKKIERAPAKPKLPVQPVQEVVVADSSNNFPLMYQDTKRGEQVLIEESEIYGEFNFRDTILDQLDRYFVYLKRMRRHDADAFAFYKKMGITIIPYGATFWTDLQYMGSRETFDMPMEKRALPLAPYFNKQRPSFGCFAYGVNPHVEKMELEKSAGKHWLMVPKFLYFTKIKRPAPTVQPMAGGDVYSMTIWWDRPHDPKNKRKHGTPQEYFVFISSDGREVRALKCLEVGYNKIKARRRPAGHRGPHFFDIPNRCWKIPDAYVSWAKKEHLTAEQLLVGLFTEAVQHIEQSNYSMVRVAVQKNELTAVFGVNLHKLGYFFQDRDIELNEHGVKRRIFHIVRPHERHTKHGTKVVPFHFRGLSEFSWADYRVKITVPGRDHFILPDVNFGGVDEYWIEKGEEKEYLYGGEVADKLIEAMDDGKVFAERG
jgi:hypothetical protein